MHPHHEHKAHKVEKRRVKELTKGYASGGAVRAYEADEVNDKPSMRKSVKKTEMESEGSKPKHRADKRARGGRTKKKGTTVNIINAPGHAMGGAPMAGMPMPPPGMPPRPMMPPQMPPQGAMPPPIPGGGMIRRSGGATGYAKGGSVGPAWKEGVKNGTQVQHSDGKNDGKDIGRKRVVTFKAGGRIVKFAAGGKVEAPKGVAPATKLGGGSGGGEARLEKEKRARRDYAEA